MIPTNPTSGCPDPETLGMLNEGKLTGTEFEEVQRHLASCDACVEAIGVASAWLRYDGTMSRAIEPSRLVIMHSRARHATWLAAAAAVIMVAGITFWLGRPKAGDARGVAPLIAAAPANYRVVEPRLSGFTWARLKQVRSTQSDDDPAYLKLAGAAGEVLERAQRDSSVEAKHAAGVANLLLRKPAKAIGALEDASTRTRDAAVWNDLAAGRYLLAVQSQRPADLPVALAAADKAIEFSPRFAEAHFNRALILTRMGLRDDAAAEWREYLTIDSTSPWSQEARERLAALQTPKRSFRDALRALDAKTAGAVVAEFPQEARSWFEVEVLGVWGEAMLRDRRDDAGRRGDAVSQLGIARSIAASLREKNGEKLLADAIAAIDGAAHDPARLRMLADAHSGYRAARLAYRDLALQNAERGLRDAASKFDSASSPMADVARFYVACALIDQNRVAEARTLLEELAARSRNGHVALRAQVHSKLGPAYGYDGRWSEALRALRIALRDFQALGETRNAAYTSAVIASTYDLAGERDEAWTHRVAALDLLSRAGEHDRIVAALSDAVRADMRSGSRVASALLRIEIEEAKRAGQPLFVADAYRRRALLAAETNEFDEGVADLAEARQIIATVGDSGLRTRLAAECDVAEGVLVRRRDPARSVTLLSSALKFFEASGTRLFVPDCLLQRGRSYRASGRLDKAHDDFAAAIEAIDEQRHHAAAMGDDGLVVAASALFEESVELLIDRGENELAFAFAERGHSRALLEHLSAGATPATAGEIRAALPAGTALLEIVSLPKGIAIFRVTPGEIRVFRQTIEDAMLRSSNAELREVIRREGPIVDIVAIASKLYAELIAPALAGIDAESLILVGGPEVQSLPWPALYDATRKQYLIERFSLTVAPSAAIWRANSRRGVATQGNRLLIVSNRGEGRPDLGELAAVEEEIRAIADLYRDRELLAGADATPSRFLAAAANADVVHFAGHARATADAPDPALLLTADANGSAELYASQIARSSLPRPRLAVLAACDTMTRETQRPDALPSLARAFLAAGVPEVVGTLWPIDDQHAAALFAEFHRRLAVGESTANALRHAQLSLLRGGTNASHPIGWASVEIIGG